MKPTTIRQTLSPQWSQVSTASLSSGELEQSIMSSCSEQDDHMQISIISASRVLQSDRHFSPHVQGMHPRAVHTRYSPRLLNRSSSEQVMSVTEVPLSHSPRALNSFRAAKPLMSTSASARCLEVAVKDSKDPAIIAAFESDYRHQRVQEYVRAHSQRVNWLETNLRQQIDDYEHEWHVRTKHEAEEQRSKAVLFQQKLRMTEAVSGRKQAREHREQKVQENGTTSKRNHAAKMQDMMSKESARELRLAKEHIQRRADIAKRACEETARRSAVLEEGIYIAEAKSLAHATKSRFKSQKVEAMLSETKRLDQLQRETSEDVSWAVREMKDMISEQRVRSVIDVTALNYYMNEILGSLQNAKGV
jgi:hypothetical protein